MVGGGKILSYFPLSLTFYSNIRREIQKNVFIRKCGRRDFFEDCEMVLWNNFCKSTQSYLEIVRFVYMFIFTYCIYTCMIHTHKGAISFLPGGAKMRRGPRLRGGKRAEARRAEAGGDRVLGQENF